MFNGGFASVFFFILVVLWGSSETHAQEGCTAPTALVPEDIAELDACDSYFKTAGGDGDYDVCGPIDVYAAARLCFDTGINLDGARRQYRCIPHTSNNLELLEGEGPTYAQIEGDAGIGCHASATGDPDCFLNCYPDTPNTLAGANDCGGETMRTAVECIDINECTDGVLSDCTGPFDYDCVCGIACGPGAQCVNTPGSYMCTCPDGYTYNLDAAKHITIGCEDINECTMNSDTCSDANELCENTIGSYYCLCKAFDGLFRGDTAASCPEGNCGELKDATNSNGWTGEDGYGDESTTTCDDGYEPSLSNEDDEVSTECRNDGKWCQCNPLTCKKKKCGIPHHDGNADVESNSRVTGTLLKYECLEGFKAGTDDEYEILCENSGAWEGVDLRCADDDECSDKNICPEHSDCINTIGSYYCHCHPGFEGNNCDERVSCGEVPIVAHAERLSVPADEIGRFEDVVNYRCEEGYHVSTNHNPHQVERDFDITCKFDKCWTPAPIPHCVPVMCGDPGDLKHASRVGGLFHYKSKVAYTCHDGFELSGYHTTEYNKIKTFEMTCEKDGWTEKHYCEDIDECKDYDHPCGVGGRHHCINRKGSYTCSCAPGFRVDKTGRQCIGLPTLDIKDVSDPCEVFSTLGFCKHGHCVLDGAGTPRCSCDEGFKGTFCDRGQPMDHSLAFIMAIVDIGVGALSLIVTILLACCVCSRQHQSRSGRHQGHQGNGHHKHHGAPAQVYVRHGQVPSPFHARIQGPLGFVN